MCRFYSKSFVNFTAKQQLYKLSSFDDKKKVSIVSLLASRENNSCVKCGGITEVLFRRKDRAPFLVCIDGSCKNAFCIVRPPGHHACIDKSMGFCVFNNVAVAAHYLINEYSFSNIAIIDTTTEEKKTEKLVHINFGTYQPLIVKYDISLKLMAFSGSGKSLSAP